MTAPVLLTETQLPVVTEPGVYDMPEDAYHADPVPGGSLSSSGARRLLPPHCPALFHHERHHGRPGKRAFDVGHAAHTAVLGTGAPVVVVQKTRKDGTAADADDYATKSAQEHRDAIHAAGMVPLLRSEAERVDGMAGALRRHRLASTLLDPEHGRAEQSLFRVDPDTGTWLRARLDFLRDPEDGRLVIVDYKTARNANPASFDRAMAAYGYHQQAAWYRDMSLALGLASDVAFRLIVQEKTAPYLVAVMEPDDEALAIGADLNRDAIDLYADCVKHDRWPGYSDDIALISLPPWATYEHDLDVI